MPDIALALKILATWLVVDFISGVVHWCEDSYGSPATPFVGRHITRPNLLHHFRPRAFVGNNWYGSSKLLVAACLASLAVAYVMGHLSPMVVLAAALGANANQVHKWSHRTTAENGRLVSLAQRIGLVQSPRHHHQHHVDGKDSHYCVLTNLLNPVLDGLGFWRGVEWLLRQVGIEKRNDDAMLAAVLRDEPDFLDRRANRTAPSAVHPG